jgi:hypothetical protein
MKEKKPRNKYPKGLPDKYKKYLVRATNKGMSFKVSVEEFELVCSKSCTYCGSTDKIGVDRIDSFIGYEIGNIQPACTICNVMKNSHSEEVWLSHIQSIYNYSILKG